MWRLTNKGREVKALSRTDALGIFKSVQGGITRSRNPAASSQLGETSVSADEPLASLPPATPHRDEVLAMLQSLPPDGFERFCQELLRESDFQEVTVTGRTGDGGIDGVGILQVNRLVSLKVVFQCKRYKGTVGSPQVRDVRGAMQGRADKGIMLTTGTFSAEAKREALRDGASPIELVDGEKVVRIMEELEIGLTPVQPFSINRSYFDDFGLGTKNA